MPKFCRRLRTFNDDSGSSNINMCNISTVGTHTRPVQRVFGDNLTQAMTGGIRTDGDRESPATRQGPRLRTAWVLRVRIYRAT